MITEKGKSIIAKYLIGQSPAYASYIAIGCGAKPLDSSTGVFGDYSDQKSLDFEMLRVPIISRGFVNEDGDDKIVLTAELPSDERYEITEVGVYSAGSNSFAGALDSRTLFSFTQSENWEYHKDTEATSIKIVYDPLDGTDEDNVINETEKVFQTNADNRLFTDDTRLDRNERCRFLNNIILMSGNSSKIQASQLGKLSIVPQWTLSGTTYNSEHIHLNGNNIDLNRQSPLDELRLAFSVINKDGNATVNPKRVMLLLEFDSADAHNTGQYARFEVDITHTTGHASNDFSTNRYFIINKQLQELTKSGSFSWTAVNTVKFSVCILDQNDNPSSDFYVALDALRIENTDDLNVLYGLVGYSVIKNVQARPITKLANSTNFVEFRFNIGVL
jgi:hypothetical protein